MSTADVTYDDNCAAFARPGSRSQSSSTFDAEVYASTAFWAGGVTVGVGRLGTVRDDELEEVGGSDDVDVDVEVAGVGELVIEVSVGADDSD